MTALLVRYPGAFSPSEELSRGESGCAAAPTSDIDARHPDRFIVHLLDPQPEKVYQSAKQQRADLRNPPKSQTELLETYVGQGLTRLHPGSAMPSH
jgi:hypothetical protein